MYLDYFILSPVSTSADKRTDVNQRARNRNRCGPESSAEREIDERERSMLMNGKWKQTMSLASMLVAAALLAMSLAQNAAADQNDPPGRVARLKYVQGAVSFQPAGEPDWVSAVVNRPMTTGDKLWADTDARAELRIGSATN